MSNFSREARDLSLLEEIERDPDTSQINLATRLGVAVGTVNWHLKRLIAKGYIKVRRAERRKLRYIITPDGIALRARLTMTYIENSMSLYRQVREDTQELLSRARGEGCHAIYIDGDGDIADVCRLSCLEGGFQLAEEPHGVDVAVVEIRGKGVNLRFPAEEERR